MSKERSLPVIRERLPSLKFVCIALFDHLVEDLLLPPRRYWRQGRSYCSSNILLISFVLSGFFNFGTFKKSSRNFSGSDGFNTTSFSLTSKMTFCPLCN